MKTKLLAVALLATSALIAPVQAGGHPNGGGGGGGFVGGGARGGRGGGAPSFHSMSVGRFGGGRMMYSGQRFSSTGMRPPVFRQGSVNAFGRAPIGTRNFTPGNINRGNRAMGFASGRTGVGQGRNGSNLPSNWRNHVAAQHAANWHRDWDRGRDHWWHGHRCRFVNGSWFIFDFGFDPWWPYWYPYDYYGYGYGYDGYPYGDDQSYYGNAYSDQNGYADQSANSVVAAVQDRLAREGYYRGQIDGVAGPETQQAIASYQSNHGLRVTGSLTNDTLAALGLRQVASY